MFGVLRPRRERCGRRRQRRRRPRAAIHLQALPPLVGETNAIVERHAHHRRQLPAVDDGLASPRAVHPAELASPTPRPVSTHRGARQTPRPRSRRSAPRPRWWWWSLARTLLGRARARLVVFSAALNPFGANSHCRGSPGSSDPLRDTPKMGPFTFFVWRLLWCSFTWLVPHGSKSPGTIIASLSAVSSGLLAL